jgi:hypothetical protein
MWRESPVSLAKKNREARAKNSQRLPRLALRFAYWMLFAQPSAGTAVRPWSARRGQQVHRNRGAVRRSLPA